MNDFLPIFWRALREREKKTKEKNSERKSEMNPDKISTQRKRIPKTLIAITKHVFSACRNVKK
jgi:hypothetical protein